MTMSDLLENPVLTDELLQEIVRRILSVGSPLKIVLFGSLARGDAKPDSDLDLLIVEESLPEERNCRHKYRDALRGIWLDKDIIVRSLRDVIEWRSVPNSFLTSILAEGRVLYRAEYPRETAAENLVVREGFSPKQRIDLARGWFENAEHDLASVRALLATDSPNAVICALVQQVMEKYLKGFIGCHGKRIPHTHDLEELYAACREVELLQELEGLELKEITDYLLAGRYDSNFRPDKGTAEGARAAAEATQKAVLSRVPTEAHPRESWA